MVLSTLRFWYLGWIDDHYINPLFHFKYFGFEWVQVLSAQSMYLIHAVMLIAALGIAIGFFYRTSAVLFFLTFSYTELIDLTYYLNHYYFVSLVALIMVFLPANKAVSIDALLNRSIRKAAIPYWTIGLIKFQLAVVYTYAGIAKINATWLFEAMPLKLWLPAHAHLPVLGQLFAAPETAYVFSWIGMIFDCSIVFFLVYHRTRVLAWIALLFFHLTTGYLFQIGVFPLVMTGATLIFFSPLAHERFLSLFHLELFRSSQKVVREHMSLGVSILIGLYVLFQLVFPWRFMLYSGNLFWNEEGYRFSWRVMLIEKAGTATFFVHDYDTGREGVVVNSDYLNHHQEKQMSFQPDMILQFAHFLGDTLTRAGVNVSSIRCETYVTLNGKPSKLLIDPEVNLLEYSNSCSQKSWVLPWED